MCVDQEQIAGTPRKCRSGTIKGDPAICRERPAKGLRRLGLVGRVQPPVEFGFLGFCQGDRLGNLGHAIPKIADQLNPLGNTEVQNVLACKFAHSHRIAYFTTPGKSSGSSSVKSRVRSIYSSTCQAFTAGPACGHAGWRQESGQTSGRQQDQPRHGDGLAGLRAPFRVALAVCRSATPGESPRR